MESFYGNDPEHRRVWEVKVIPQVTAEFVQECKGPFSGELKIRIKEIEEETQKNIMGRFLDRKIVDTILKYIEGIRAEKKQATILFSATDT